MCKQSYFIQCYYNFYALLAVLCYITLVLDYTGLHRGSYKTGPMLHCQLIRI